MSTVVTIILAIALTLLLTVIVCVLVPCIKARTTEEQWETIMRYVKTAVSAAEQIFQGTGRGAEKKDYVLTWLQKHGIMVENNEIDAMIESAVYELNSSELLIGEPLETVNLGTINVDSTDPDNVPAVTVSASTPEG